MRLANEGNHMPKIVSNYGHVENVVQQINSEVNSDDVQELLDFHHQMLTMDGILEMHEQQHIEEHESLYPVQSEDWMMISNMIKFNLIEK
ncbi:hypothetical protein TNCV_2354331 [Trichonephila clavipes]|nr:hypothetical protein TNCV_2354331 [Trichonephila clavipes]